jgi:hypothetical protein
MAARNCNILCWNVRGLNDGAKRVIVRNQIISSGATVVCLQETKISNWTHSLLVDTVGTDMANNVVFLPLVGVCGGILIAALEHFFHSNSTISINQYGNNKANNASRKQGMVDIWSLWTSK